MGRGAVQAWETTPRSEPLGEGVARRIQRRAIRRTFAHGVLLVVPFVYVFLTWLR